MKTSLILIQKKGLTKGFFISFQYPLEIAGISNEEFLYHAYIAKLKSKNQQEISQDEFCAKILLPHVRSLKMDESFFITRSK